ncbi:MAG: tetratricopeptide repeat protein [Leptospiraceae bacterium]|nr:tetratricopeptide repeat protein [Leptospiraceae bacterium]
MLFSYYLIRKKDPDRRAGQGIPAAIFSVLISTTLATLLLSSFSISLEAAPTFEEIRQQGLESFDAKDYHRAKQYFKRAYELQPYNDNVRFYLALSLVYQDPDRAVQKPDQPFLPEKDYRDDLRLAIALLKNSLEVQERIEVRSPATGLRHFHLGMAYWFAGRPDLALDSFRRSFRSDFTRTDALYNRIVILKQMGKKKEASIAIAEYTRMTSIGELDD